MGNWQLPVVISLSKFKNLVNHVGSLSNFYEDQEPTWLKRIHITLHAGEQHLSEQARHLASTFPKWIKYIARVIMQEFSVLPTEELAKIRNALNALKVALTIGLVERNTLYYIATSRSYNLDSSKRFFDEILPSLEINSIKDRALSVLAKSSDSSVIRIITAIAREALNDLTIRTDDYSLISEDYIASQVNNFSDEMREGVLSAQLSKAIAIVDVALNHIDDLSNIERSVLYGLYENAALKEDPIGDDDEEDNKETSGTSSSDGTDYTVA